MVSLCNSNERILCVDDEGAIAKMGSQILDQLGYTVATRTSSFEALELFRSKPSGSDLAVTDMTMSNMTGDKLAVELMRIRSDIRVFCAPVTVKKYLTIQLHKLASRPLPTSRWSKRTWPN